MWQVDAERSYHRSIVAILDKLHAEVCHCLVSQLDKVKISLGNVHASALILKCDFCCRVTEYIFLFYFNWVDDAGGGTK